MSSGNQSGAGRLAVALARRVGFAVALVLVSTGTAAAQQRISCRSPQPPSVGLAVGYSDPYVENTGPNGSVRRGPLLLGRADLPLSGPLRLRIEGGAARWAVGAIDAPPADRITARHLVALAGLQMGQAPTCAHVSAGGGLYSLGLPGSSVRAGVAIGAGMEFPTGPVGAVQVDATLHVVGARDADHLASAGALVGTLTIGWAFRF